MRGKDTLFCFATVRPSVRPSVRLVRSLVPLFPCSLVPLFPCSLVPLFPSLPFPSEARWIGSAIVGRPVNAVKHNMDMTTTTTNTDTLGLEGDFRILEL